MLVGNKTDLEKERAVGQEEAMAFSKKHDMEYVETAALDASGVEVAFNKIITDIYFLMARRSLAAREERSQASLNSGQSITIHGKNTDINGCMC